ncbi:early nodulin-like protein 9 isoform X2 [Musa acuminata AAA Group]|uniref:early nodulin-like protein 9 isoform X2 n=1 Tax=Musa acuminata AAA Group TaxID=214697 RepID=UPI0031D60F41
MSNYVCLILLSFFMLISIAAGTQFKVGGSNGWSVPDSNAMSYNQWAEKNRFKISDSLLFVYLPDEDSVLLVDADAYNSCNTSSFVDFFNDGNTVFSFTRSGHFYFISGKKDNCDKNEKLVVVVMADRSNSSSLAPAPLPASASPPPYGWVVEEPTAQPPPPNGASSRVVGMVSTIGAVLGALSYAF